MRHKGYKNPDPVTITADTEKLALILGGSFFHADVHHQRALNNFIKRNVCAGRMKAVLVS